MARVLTKPRALMMENQTSSESAMACFARPVSRPGAIGTSRATGLSRRAMTASSQRSLAAISRDSWVLASWILTCMASN